MPSLKKQWYMEPAFALAEQIEEQYGHCDRDQIVDYTIKIVEDAIEREQARLRAEVEKPTELRSPLPWWGGAIIEPIQQAIDLLTRARDSKMLEEEVTPSPAPALKSACCGAEMRMNREQEPGNEFIFCSKCGRPCDGSAPSTSHNSEGEEKECQKAYWDGVNVMSEEIDRAIAKAHTQGYQAGVSDAIREVERTDPRGISTVSKNELMNRLSKLTKS